MKNPHSGLKARIASFGYAFKGIATLVREQPNARIHLLATCIALGFAFWLGFEVWEWCVLLLTMAGVWLAEGMNTAIEYVVDLVSPDYHELAGKAKDVAAGAVLIMAIFAVGVGLFLFLPKIWALFQSAGG